MYESPIPRQIVDGLIGKVESGNSFDHTVETSDKDHTAREEDEIVSTKYCCLSTTENGILITTQTRPFMDIFRH